MVRLLLLEHFIDGSPSTIGHFDVQPASKSDGWNTEPFVLTPDNQGRLFGRGSTDDKGPVIGWLNVIEAHQKTGTELPVNLKMCFEGNVRFDLIKDRFVANFYWQGMEESGSEGLDELIEREANEYFKGVDAVCIS
jgi:Cys-Gly metallodipeptidase DUG1